MTDQTKVCCIIYASQAWSSSIKALYKAYTTDEIRNIRDALYSGCALWIYAYLSTQGINEDTIINMIPMLETPPDEFSTLFNELIETAENTRRDCDAIAATMSKKAFKKHRSKFIKSNINFKMVIEHAPALATKLEEEMRIIKEYYTLGTWKEKGMIYHETSYK
jgi:hypothetical protein